MSQSCTNENCNARHMDIVEQDDRQEWYTAIYECPECGKRLEHHREYDQNGLIIKDEVKEL